MSAAEFVKMEGLGNDFIFLQIGPGDFTRLGRLAPELCHRNLGIGADGLVLYQPHERGALLSIFNADGSMAKNCGNALRCAAQLLWKQLPGRQHPELQLRIEGGVEAVATHRWMGEELWPVIRMDPPEFEPEAIPMILGPGMSAPVLGQELRLGAEPLRVSCVSVGNPHCVLFTEELDEQRLLRLGPRIEHLNLFPDRTNVEMCRVVSRVHLEVLVWERGVGATMACGTGACAAAVTARMLGLTEATVAVDLPGGSLEVTWLGEGLPIFLAGPAREVFRGTIQL